MRAFIGLLCWLISTAAFGQGAVLQGGSWTPGHVPMYVGMGSGQAIVQDSGPAGGGTTGLGISELLLVARGTGTPPYSGQASGPDGTNFCNFDAPTDNPTGYHYVCMSPNATVAGVTGTVISTGSGGAATPLPFYLCSNGACVTPNGGVAGITINTTTIGGGTDKGLLYDNAGTVGNLATLANGILVTNASGVPSISTTVPTGVSFPITVGTTPIGSGTPNGLLFDNAGVFGNLATANNGVLITSGGGVPSISSTLPSGINLTAANLGTPASGLLTNATGYLVGNLAGAGTGVLTALGVNIGSAGAPVLFNGALGTPSSGVGTNLTALNATNIGSGTLNTARLPSPFTNGTASGNTTKFGTVSGSPSVGSIATWDANGNLQDGGGPGGVTHVVTPQGRLSISTGVPVMTSGVTGATSHFYVPYVGNTVPIYNGTSWTPLLLTGQLTQTCADTTKSPAACANSSNYDVFVWSDAGTARATRGPAWSSSTTRGTGAGTTELVRVDGVLMNANAITNGPLAQRGVYVGTFRTNGTATIDWSLGGSASGGTAGNLSVWNMYNRVAVSALVIDTGVGYTYTSATVRQARASAGNQISFIAGLIEDSFTATMMGQVTTSGAASAFGQYGVGLNTTSAFSAGRSFVFAPTAVANIGANAATANLLPGLGLNVISANEASDGTNANTFNNSNVNNLSANLRM